MQLTISEQFQKYMKSIGIDLNDTLQKAGVNQILWKEHLELNNSEYWRLMNELDNELSDENIVELSEINKMNTFMPAFFASLTAENGLEALKRLAKYKSLVGPVKLDIVDNGTETKIQISGNELSIEPPRFTVMTEQLLVLSLLRTGTAKDIVPIKVCSNNDYGQIISNVFQIKPQRQAENEIIFRDADLQDSFISSNNVMWEFIRPELDRRKLEIESSKQLGDNIQALLIKKIPSGKFGIDDIAENLNISRRTLQRNLKNLNTSFNDQVKYARQTLVDPFMKDESLSLIDISYLLGYADPESFSRAFKTWYKKSPSIYRKQVLN